MQRGQRGFELPGLRLEHGPGEQHLRVVGHFPGQALHALAEFGLLSGTQLFEIVEHRGEVDLFARARQQGEVRQRLDVAALANQQDRQGVVGLEIVGLQFHPQLRRFQGFRLPGEVLGQVGGVGADAGVAQQWGLGAVLLQRHIEGAATQGEFRQQQRVHAVIGNGAFRGWRRRGWGRGRSLGRLPGPGCRGLAGTGEQQRTGNAGKK